MSVLNPNLPQRYRVLSRLGEGNMGEVWRVEDSLNPEAPRALKRIKVDLSAEKALILRFRAEFHAMARLRHPNIVGVHDYGVMPDGSVYLVMDWVPGNDLGEVIANQPMRLEQFYPLFAQLLQALDYLHARQYVHRDVKSANVRVRPDGRLILMDFGLADRVGSELTGGVSGTPGYLAPEILLKRPATSKTDLYAVGCLAYEMLTGHLPFQGNVAAVLRAHLQQQPPSLAKVRRDLPGALIRLVEGLMGKDPAARPRSAAQVLVDLTALAGDGVTRESVEQRQSFLNASELIGREAELQIFEQVLNQTLAGTGGGVLIGAPAGMGKSRLLQEVTLRAQLAGFRVLHGHCREDGAMAYEAVRESLRVGLADAAPELVARHRESVEALFPERRVDATIHQVVTPRGVMAMLTDLATHSPLLWILDDLHWADPQTIGLLNTGIRELQTNRILCIGTFRDDETPLSNPVWQTIEDEASLFVRLQALSRQAQDGLIAGLLPDASVPEGFAEALYRATGGNPLFVQEALHTLVDEAHLRREGGRWCFPVDDTILNGLRQVETIIQRRIDGLHDEPRNVLQAAAVLGLRANLHTLAACVDLPEDRLFEALEDLAERQFLLQDQAGGFVFPHDRVREAARAGIAAEAISKLHLRAAQALLEWAGESVQAYAADLAWHFLRGGDDARGYHWALRAADTAASAGADYVAIQHLEAADDALSRLPGDRLDERLPIWLRLGRDGFHLNPVLATQALARAHAAHDAEPERADALLAQQDMDLGQVIALRARVLGLRGEVNDALTLADRLEAHDAAERSGQVILAANSRYLALMNAGRIDEGVKLAKRWGAHLDGLQGAELVTEIRWGAIANYAFQNAGALQGLRPSVAVLDKALAAAAMVDDPDPLLPRIFFGVWSAWAGHFDETDAYIRHTTNRTRAIGAPLSPFVVYLQSFLPYHRGEYTEALRLLERALLVHTHVHHQALALNFCLILRGRLLDALGREDEALCVFDALLQSARERGLGLARLHALIGRGSVLRDIGRIIEARTSYNEALQLASAGPLRNPLIQAQASLGLGVCDSLQNHATALTQLDAALAIASQPELDNRLLSAHIHRARARALERLGQPEAAASARREAQRFFEQMGLSYWVYQLSQDALITETVPQPAPPKPILNNRFERFNRLM